MTKTLLWFSMALSMGSMAAFTTGCELITSVDASLIKDNPSGSGGSHNSSTTTSDSGDRKSVV